MAYTWYYRRRCLYMRATATNHKELTMQIELMLDPTGHYENSIGDDWYERVVSAIGILAAFTVGPEESIADNMEKNYQFFSHWSEGQGARVENKCFCYPQDPPQYPLMSATHGNEVVYVYQNCIVAQTIDGQLTKWTRMD